jgi:hypothetical protein
MALSESELKDIGKQVGDEFLGCIKGKLDSSYPGSRYAAQVQFARSAEECIENSGRNFIIWLEQGMVMVKPPIWKSDTEGMKSDFHPDEWLHEPQTESMVILQDLQSGDVLSAETKKDVLVALYDAYQTSDVLKPGDTFTFKGENIPFAKCTDIHVIPLDPAMRTKHPLDIDSLDIGHQALVYGKEGVVVGVSPNRKFYNILMGDGSYRLHEPKANVTVLEK